MTENKLEDQQRAQFDEYVCEEISDRVAEGVYFDADLVWFDTTIITITDHDNEPWTPLSLFGMALACIGGTGVNVYLNWTARFAGKRGNKLTYKVQRKDGGIW